MGELSPLFRNVFTDITGGIVDHQQMGRCARQEMDFRNCLEGYGWDRGLIRCKHLLEDFQECQTNRKQFLRFMAMRRERNRKIACGEISKDKEYVSPRIDSY
ncbi:NADH dehydrogenase [ubiquinone] iron-sulfur protein 5-like [Pararge aegeria]|uniref:Jg5954 protein n=1 Tax=Pararge aegeria aegeria TaxID=348720 RepID=A0A8S4RI34_9NEOP|nr:NADH dehydrogenase [ubiquinone] iron-sulfur protein 5-like [Pararge aegeria]CAH2235386.1 jg5954 [Pararge aegeria aegeria]